jgi:hypothetical protein
MNYVSFFIKSYNISVIKAFMDLKLGPVFTENIDGEGIYIIDEDYPINIQALHQPYFLLVHNNENFTINEYFQDYFIKPLDYSLIKKKLLIFFHIKTTKNPWEASKKEYFLWALERWKYHQDSWQTNLILGNGNNPDTMAMDLLLKTLTLWWSPHDNGSSLKGPLMDGLKPINLMGPNDCWILLYYLSYLYLISDCHVPGAYIQVIDKTYHDYQVVTNVPLDNLIHSWVSWKKNKDIFSITFPL